MFQRFRLAFSLEKTAAIFQPNQRHERHGVFHVGNLGVKTKLKRGSILRRENAFGLAEPKTAKKFRATVASGPEMHRHFPVEFPERKAATVFQARFSARNSSRETGPFPAKCQFLKQTFKREHKVALPEGELRAALAAYLEELRETDPFAYPKSTAEYLADWCDDVHGFLRRYYADDAKRTAL